MSSYNTEMSLSMTFDLLDELSEIAPNILEKCLKKIYDTMTQLKSGMLDSDDYAFYAREEIMDRHRDYLVKLATSDKYTKKVKEMAIRLIIVSGNFRSSGEDYLVAYNLISDQNLTLNIDSELSLNKYFQEGLVSSDSSEASSFKVNMKGSQEVEIVMGLNNDVNKNTFSRFAFEKNYIYIYNQNAGFFKFGLKQSLTSSPGIRETVSTTNPTNQTGSLVHVKEKLIYRPYGSEDADASTNPIEVLDKYTLDFIDSEKIKAVFIKNKRNLVSDEPNKPILEFTTSELKDSVEKGKDPFRVIATTPIFTDGDYLYVISHHIKNVGEDEDQGIDHIELEAYCPDTGTFIKKVELNFEPEERQNSTPDIEAKISEETETIKLPMY
jgi:hypothetical protein